MANGRCGKTIDTGTTDRGSTVEYGIRKLTVKMLGKVGFLKFGTVTYPM